MSSFKIFQIPRKIIKFIDETSSRKEEILKFLNSRLQIQLIGKKFKKKNEFAMNLKSEKFLPQTTVQNK